jgi:hypothetical protein
LPRGEDSRERGEDEPQARRQTDGPLKAALSLGSAPMRYNTRGSKSMGGGTPTEGTRTMLSTVRTAIAAAALAIAGIAAAGSASAAPLNPAVAPNKLAIKFCIPHVKKYTRYLGIKKIGYRYYRVYATYTIYTNRYCKKTIYVSYKYVPLPWFYKGKPAGV